jgi:hypothetical protein
MTLKNDVNVPSKSSKKKKLGKQKLFFVGLEGHCRSKRAESRAESGSVRGTDPWIRIKSWTRICIKVIIQELFEG